MIKIIPAILTKDPKDLEDKLKKLKGLVDWVQIDVLDGKFVNNNSIQPEDLPQVLTKNFNLEIHLMVQNPENYFKECQNIGAKRVIFHAEAVENLHNLLNRAKKFNFKVGLALNPETPVKQIQPYLNQINLVILLGVNPGFQGQKFIPSVLNKIKFFKQLAPKIKIEIDGGINLSNIKQIAKAGADYLVIGNALFGSKNFKERLRQLNEKLKKG